MGLYRIWKLGTGKNMEIGAESLGIMVRFRD